MRLILCNFMNTPIQIDMFILHFRVASAKLFPNNSKQSSKPDITDLSTKLPHQSSISVSIFTRWNIYRHVTESLQNN